MTAAILLGLLVGCAPDGASDASASGVEVAGTGSLVIVGGGLASTNEDIYRQILGGRDGEGPVCVIPTASGDPPGSMEWAVERIDEWGGEGTARGVLLSLDDPDRAKDPGVAAELRECSGYFFTGGDQSRILDVFLPEGVPTAAYDAVMKRFAEGAVVSGSSAGAAMVSDPMIAGGSSEAAFGSGVTADESEPGVYIRPGMGFLRGTLIDQHFLARGRIGRLIVAVLHRDDVRLGWGIDENTALVVQGGVARVVGASGVVLVDGSDALREGELPAAARGLRLHLLGDGDRVDLRTLEVTPGAGKEPLVEADGDEGASPEGGVFDRWQLLHVLHRIALERPESVTLEADGYALRLAPDAGFQARAFAWEGVERTPHGLSVGPLALSIEAR